MPSVESDCREQKAAYWAANGFDDYGDYKVSAAIEIKVRWEEVVDEVVDANGNTQAIDAVAVVDRDIAPGSILWLGALADVASPPVDLMQVVTRKKTPDIKGREFRRVVLLKRFSDELPTIA